MAFTKFTNFVGFENQRLQLLSRAILKEKYVSKMLKFY
jgi:hypothetical protein